MEYELNGNVVEFIGADQPQKIRGRKRDYLWLNEANEISYDAWKQLSLRTTGNIWLDYNPSDEYHWIYDSVVTREDCTFIKSTYKDNKFLPESVVQEIERLKDENPQYWKIYGLGERGTAKTTIYTDWNYVDELPETYDYEIFGLDFGYNNPSTLVRIRVYENRAFVQELVYQSHLTNTELIQACKPHIDKRSLIFADSAESDRIREFQQAGYTVKRSDKDVAKGIDTVKTFQLYITKDSGNILKEIKNYKYVEKKTGEILDVPIKLNDHAMDAMRYALHTYAKGSVFDIKKFKNVKLSI